MLYGFLLYQKLGWIYLIEISILYLLAYAFSKSEKLLQSVREKKDEIGKENSTLLNEVFNNIKMIKLYGWQDFFHKRMVDKRAEEMKLY